MPLGDGVRARQNFLDQKPDDFSASYEIQAISVVLQSHTEVAEAVNHAQVARLILSGQVQGLRLGAR